MAAVRAKRLTHTGALEYAGVVCCFQCSVLFSFSVYHVPYAVAFPSAVAYRLMITLPIILLQR